MNLYRFVFVIHNADCEIQILQVDQVLEMVLSQKFF